MTPIPPEGVVLVRANGEAIPLDLFPEPRWDEERGINQWTVATPVTFHRGDTLHVAVLPPLTSIEFGAQL